MTRFEEDLLSNRKINYNGKLINVGLYNMIVGKFQIGAYVIGINPNRGFSISDLKKYFGIKGSGKKLLDNYMIIFNHYNQGG
tara:strand:+ start:237 stop:482 length:246 start_codon:yes stop_codon:yes gene_type:complete